MNTDTTTEGNKPAECDATAQASGKPPTAKTIAASAKRVHKPAKAVSTELPEGTPKKLYSVQVPYNTKTFLPELNTLTVTKLSKACVTANEQKYSLNSEAYQVHGATYFAEGRGTRLWTTANEAWRFYVNDKQRSIKYHEGLLAEEKRELAEAKKQFAEL
ncbi:MAG TPA: hypothetical protein VG326_00670 [Tepidisphaeraceae bacterium]|jgi:hypothetical protein|nr:hypothetical protein [Tepidisphaeraceae bacterium]